MQEILLVEDNLGDARLIEEMLFDELERGGFHMRVADCLASALRLLEAAESDIVFLDLSLPDSVGLETLYRVQNKAPALPIIVLTGNEDRQLALAAVKAGAQDYLNKNDLSGGLLVKSLTYARERKRIEASLRVSEARFRSLAELSSDWYWEQDAHHVLTYMSEGFQERSGIDPARLMGRAWWALPGVTEGPWETLRNAIDRREPFHDLVFRYVRSGAEAMHISIGGVPINSGHGFAGYCGVGKDVSARERSAAALRGSEERYRHVMDAARDGIVMLDAEEVITFANRRMATMLGYEQGGLNGQKYTSLCVNSPTPRELTDLGGEEEGAGISFSRRDSSILYAMQSSYPVYGKDGQHAGTLVIVTDITEFKQREERVQQLASLAAQKSEAERANAAKSRFLAAVSHDLRQPMHALGLFIDDLRSVSMPAHTAPLLDHMQSALDTTYTLLDAILMMSRLETGMIVPNLMPFSLEPMLGQLQHAYSGVATKRQLRFAVCPTSAVAYSDPALLQRILSNLISNALRYTETGGVVVTCRQRGDALRLEVWDTGPGIPQEYQEAIFREFYRIDRADARGGVGLGLAIVRSCSELLGYGVRLSSCLGRGSRFYLEVPKGTLPVSTGGVDALLTDTIADEPLSNQFEGLRVVLVDDDLVILERTCRLLERWGCIVTAASSGPQAEALVARLTAPPDLVLTDLRLDAGEVGTDLITRLRLRLRPNLPAIVLTGDSSLETAREVRRAGLTLLYKPVPPAKLRAVMSKLLET
ncbi:response regulator [Hydrogenophaga sp.]|uniref:response regulator n=1 Tax=Hydrogenophaga sp. TaxID=1904254 RepID=UPI00271E46A4|nr:response regulator [Hydrogenophaga sp.]MDO9438739.1 response regulator [Hydrogenophaga sp.]